MKKSIKVDQNKRRGRPATGRDPMVSSRIPAAAVAAVDEWATHNETTRSDAIRRLVELGLAVKATKPRQAPQARASRAKELATHAIDKMGDPSASAEERDERRGRLTKGPPEFREVRVDRPKAKTK
jgi:hypothetical protein